MSVLQINQVSRFDYQSGTSFGEFGEFEVQELEIQYGVDPLNAHNSGIIDLEKAPVDSEGLVRFAGQAKLIYPKNTSPKALLVDIPNRGRVISFSFNRPAVEEMTQSNYPVGDGFLWRNGFALLSIGWQVGAEGMHLNVPEASESGRRIEGQVICQMQPGRDTQSLFFAQGGPLLYAPTGSGDLYEREHQRQEPRLIDRNQWRFGRVLEDKLIRVDGFISLEGGFKAGRHYTLVYNAIGAKVIGLGLLAVRDAVSYFRHSFEWPDSEPQHVIAYGASQTGRFLRHLVYEDLNHDEQDRVVFDAIMPHIAGAQRGDFNHRFAQPGSLGILSIGQRFPFSTRESEDQLSKSKAGLLSNCSHPPKILITNTSFEYWRGDAALAHISTDEQSISDLPPADDEERIYLFAGTHHINAVFPPTDQFLLTSERIAHPLNTISFTPLIRAVLINALNWLDKRVEPPDSSYPTLSDGTLVSRETVMSSFGKYEEFGALLDARQLVSLWFTDLGDQADEGVGAFPAKMISPYPTLVPAVGDDLNEISGIRLPEISLSIGIHSGWNPRHPNHGASQQAATFAGFSIFKHRVLPERDMKTLQLQIEAATDELIAARWVLEEDRELVVQNALQRAAYL